jgi:[ribosomal protein S5]-alanine N-acetyltransferase
MEFIPIRRSLEENGDLLAFPEFGEILRMSVAFYERVGFDPPWIGYFVKEGDQWVGSAGFKGKPMAGKVEIAYGVQPAFQRRGFGTAICRQLVQLALQTDPRVRVAARTLPDNRASIGVLKKNGFELLGMIWDEEDGHVLEWKYVKGKVEVPEKCS